MKTVNPNQLSTEAKRWKKRLESTFELGETDAQLLLQVLLESFDRMRAAQAILTAEGLTIEDRFKQKRAHPMLLVERDSRTALQRALRELHLDVEPPNPKIGRPPGGKNR